MCYFHMKLYNQFSFSYIFLLTNNCAAVPVAVFSTLQAYMASRADDSWFFLFDACPLYIRRLLFQYLVLLYIILSLVVALKIIMFLYHQTVHVFFKLCLLKNNNNSNSYYIILLYYYVHYVYISNIFSFCVVIEIILDE